MRQLLILLLTLINLNVQASETAVEMKQLFGPKKTFSIMAPSDWLVSESEQAIYIGTPNDKRYITIKAYSIPAHPAAGDFSKVKFESETSMSYFKQVGEEYLLTTNGGAVRQYKGIYPGDNYDSFFVTVCINKLETYACLSLITTEDDYKTNQVFYKKMLSTFQIHSQPLIQAGRLTAPLNSNVRCQ